MEDAKRYVGEIEPFESREIEPVIERIAGLEELLLIVKDETLSDKIKNEMAGLRLECNKWWKKLVESHGWKIACDTHWEVDYEENKVWIY